MFELCRWTLGLVGTLLALLLLRIGFGDRIAGSRSGQCWSACGMADSIRLKGTGWVLSEWSPIRPNQNFGCRTHFDPNVRLREI